MRHEIDYERARARHAELVEKALNELSERLRKKNRTLDIADVTWSYYWAVGFEHSAPGPVEVARPSFPGEILDRCFVSLAAKVTMMEASFALSPEFGQPTPREMLPVEVIQIHADLDKIATEEETPHIASFDTFHIGQSTKGLIQAGAQAHDGTVALLVIYAGDREKRYPTLYEASEDGISNKGMPRTTFINRMLDAEVGEGFSYMRKEYIKMSDQDICDVVVTDPPAPNF